ncbi:alkaline phosphatase PhoX [Nonomuraea thailandensis]
MGAHRRPRPRPGERRHPCTLQGLAKGGAKFNRLEGCWYGDGSVFFNSTSGGDAKNGDPPNADGYLEGYGQVWQYVPGRRDGGTLVLVYESPGRKELDSPDNLTFTPRGGIVLCEDDAGSADADPHPLAPGLVNVNRLIGLDPRRGQPFEFAVNVADDCEFAGACFSPDGSVLFVNNFGDAVSLDPPGRTFAIRGPWHRGPL